MRKLNQESFLTTAEVARYLGFSTRTITSFAIAWEESGGAEGLPGRKFGKRAWPFDPDDVEAFVRKIHLAAKTVTTETVVVSRKVG